MPRLAVRSKVRILLDVINNIESGKAAAMPWAFSHQNMAVASALTRARHTDVPAKYVRVITSRKDPMAPSFVLGVIFWHYLPRKRLKKDIRYEGMAIGGI